MSQSGGDSENGGSGTASEAPRARTLPPPEWTAPTKSPRESAPSAPEPLARRSGGYAEEATMRGRVEMAARAADRGEHRAAAIALARWLASRDRDLDEAARLAEKALELGEDGELRRELAAWLESLGEAEYAAATLESLARTEGIEPPEAAYVLVRVGVLYARGGLAQ